MNGRAVHALAGPAPVAPVDAITDPLHHSPIAWRWVGAAGFVLLLHAAAVLLLTRPARVPPAPGIVPALIVELAPPSPEAEPTPEPEPAPQPEAAPPPRPVPEATKLPPEPEPKFAAEPMPGPAPSPPSAMAPAHPIVPSAARATAKRAHVVKQPPAEVQPATPPPPSTTPDAPPAPVAQPPAPSAGQAGSPSWQARLLAHLNRFKRYPAAAQMRRQEGTAKVHFRLMRDGSAQPIRLVMSTGNASLDEEATALIARAQPLPRPDNNDQAIELVVPIQFQMR